MYHRCKYFAVGRIFQCKIWPIDDYYGLVVYPPILPPYVSSKLKSSTIINDISVLLLVHEKQERMHLRKRKDANYRNGDATF